MVANFVVVVHLGQEPNIEVAYLTELFQLPNDFEISVQPTNPVRETTWQFEWCSRRRRELACIMINAFPGAGLNASSGIGDHVCIVGNIFSEALESADDGKLWVTSDEAPGKGASQNSRS